MCDRRVNRLGLFLLLASAAASWPAHGAQIVALDLKAEGDVSPKLARSLNPILLAELSRIQGMSVISQDDVRALLELESNKQRLGCADTGCMAEIAGSLGAELTTASAISTLGGAWVVSMTLINAETAKVIRRSTGKASGDEAAAEQAVISAVHDLFREGLPTEVQGPASLSRRGFQAALAGLRRSVLDVKLDHRPGRRRIILDLINTELDYDANPKLDMLDLEIRRGIGEFRRLMLVAKDLGELEHLVSAVDHYRVINDDLQRVKEIRTRSRERGIVPSATALRFEEPEPQDGPDPIAMGRYQAAAEPLHKLVNEALRAYEHRKLPEFQRFWKSDYAGPAESAYKELESNEKRYKARCEPLPFFATAPDSYESLLSTMKDGRMVVLLRCFRDGKVYDEDRVWFEQEKGTWKISSW